MQGTTNTAEQAANQDPNPRPAEQAATSTVTADDGTSAKAQHDALQEQTRNQAEKAQQAHIEETRQDNARPATTRKTAAEEQGGAGALGAYQSSIQGASAQALAAARSMLQTDDAASITAKLRALAIASEPAGTAEKNHLVWATVAALAENNSPDANAIFNAGYWALIQAESLRQPAAKEHWAQEAQARFKQAQRLLPQSHTVATHLGQAYLAQAKIAASTDKPIKAQELLRLAGHQYDRAFNQYGAQSDLAATHWGEALLMQYNIMKSQDSELAQRLLDEAIDKYNLALRHNPNSRTARNLRNQLLQLQRASGAAN